MGTFLDLQNCLIITKLFVGDKYSINIVCECSTFCTREVMGGGERGNTPGRGQNRGQQGHDRDVRGWYPMSARSL